MGRRLGTASAPALRQWTFAERLDDLARRAESSDPARPARCLFAVALALLTLGLLVQISHASTTLPLDTFKAELQSLVGMRTLGLFVLLFGLRLGPHGVRRAIPALSVVVVLLLIAVYVPGLRSNLNGARRWVDLPGLPSIQPSELARVVAVLWVAQRCATLGPRVQDGRSGYLPMLLAGLCVFVLILAEPDLGGALLFLLCFGSTMWVGGARPAHVGLSMAALMGCAVLVGASLFGYVRERLAVWVGDSANDQVTRASEAIASGDLWGVGVAQGGFRNQSLQYMQTDYAFSMVGEELGLFGMSLVLGLLLAFVWFAFRLVLSVRDRYAALAAFGLLVSVAFQAMLHVQIVTGLAPPKGMTLPFLSDGGSALVSTCLAVGLALGAARERVPSHGDGL